MVSEQSCQPTSQPAGQPGLTRTRPKKRANATLLTVSPDLVKPGKTRSNPGNPGGSPIQSGSLGSSLYAAFDTGAATFWPGEGGGQGLK
ncbi:unnamed protein product [Linum tenue]|uniref:Uncharacterized protein n=1 Tax=Linum tenue TaxID=586396 RepID=A0AAV0HTM5_9ROSI|nr:unnamed protein product [Linum tenue]